MFLRLLHSGSRWISACLCTQTGMKPGCDPRGKHCRLEVRERGVTERWVCHLMESNRERWVGHRQKESQGWETERKKRRLSHSRDVVQPGLDPPRLRPRPSFSLRWWGLSMSSHQKRTGRSVPLWTQNCNASTSCFAKCVTGWDIFMGFSEAQWVANQLWARQGQNQVCGFQAGACFLQSLKLPKQPECDPGPQIPGPQQGWGVTKVSATHVVIPGRVSWLFLKPCPSQIPEASRHQDTVTLSSISWTWTQNGELLFQSVTS